MIVLSTLESRLTDVFLGFAERRLVGNLEDAAARVGTLAKQPANRHPELVHGPDHLLHLAGDDQRGQVHHGRGAHTGAQVGRAGGEIAERRGERIVQFLLEFRVDRVDGIPGLLQLKAGPHHLNPQVILFVDHHHGGRIGRG